MMPLLQMMGQKNPDSWSNLEFENSNLHIYWKDLKGKYLGSNNSLARNGGLIKGDDLIGTSDRDLCWSEFAEELEANDQEIISTEKTTAFVEPFRSFDNKNFQFYSFKYPLRTRFHKVAGVIGISFLLNEELIPRHLYRLAKNDKPEKIDESCSIPNFGILSKRQKQCLYYLVRGMTVKGIAKVLSLSPKTVEHYLEDIKFKLKCQSRQELLMKATEYLIIPLEIQ